VRPNLNRASGRINDLDDGDGLNDTGDVGIHVAGGARGIRGLALFVEMLVLMAVVVVMLLILLVMTAAFVVMKMRVLLVVRKIAGLSE